MTTKQLQLSINVLCFCIRCKSSHRRNIQYTHIPIRSLLRRYPIQKPDSTQAPLEWLLSLILHSFHSLCNSQTHLPVSHNLCRMPNFVTAAVWCGYDDNWQILVKIDKMKWWKSFRVPTCGRTANWRWISKVKTSTQRNGTQWISLSLPLNLSLPHTHSW